MYVHTLCKTILPGVKYTQFLLHTIVSQLMVSYSNTQCLLIIYIQLLVHTWYWHIGIKHFIFPSVMICSCNYFHFWFYFTMLTPKVSLHEILTTAIIIKKWAMITTSSQCWLLVCDIWLIMFYCDSSTFLLLHKTVVSQLTLI